MQSVVVRGSQRSACQQLGPKQCAQLRSKDCAVVSRCKLLQFRAIFVREVCLYTIIFEEAIRAERCFHVQHLLETHRHYQYGYHRHCEAATFKRQA